MTILAIDLGTRTGWARRSNGVTVSGVEKFEAGRHCSAGMRGVNFENWLNRILQPGMVVYYEEVRRHMGTDAAHVYGGFHMLLAKACEARGIPYEGVPVGVIKKHWTGKGNADKKAMMAEAERRGLKPADDNEADALALLDYALSQSRSAAA